MPHSPRSLSVGRAARRWTTIACAAFVVVGVAGWTSTAAAQFDQITALTGLQANNVIDFADIKNEPRKATQLASLQLPLIQNDKPTNAVAAANFDKFHLAKLADLTWPVGNTIDKKREDFKRKYLNGQFAGAPGPEWHDRLNQLVLKNLPALIANKNLDPQARLNYAILLGQLDQLEFRLGVQNAVPMPEATQLLVTLLNTGELPEMLRVAAWMGLARHGELQVTAEGRKAMATEIAKVLNARQPLPGYSAEGFHWSRKCALQALAGLSKTGNDAAKPDTVKALHDIIADANEPLFLRRDAALALGSLDPQLLGSGAVKAPELLKALGNLTREIMRAGSPRAGNGPLQMSKAEDVLPAPDNDTRLVFANSVAYYLSCVSTGLGGRGDRGLKKSPNIDGKTLPLINELVTNHINPIVDAFAVPNINISKMTTDLAKQSNDVESWLNKNQLAQPAPAAAPAVAPIAAPQGGPLQLPPNQQAAGT